MTPRSRVVSGALAVLALAGLIACGDIVGNVIVSSTGGSDGMAGCAGTDSGCSGNVVMTSRACATGTDCIAAAPFCDAKSSRCIECRTSADCRDNSPFCHPARHACVGCLSDADCQDGERCVASLERCAASCTNNQSCPAEAPICDSSLQICISCRTNADCPSVDGPDCLNGECTDCATGNCN